MAQPEGAAPYQPKDTIGETITSTTVLGGAGIFISAAINTLTKQNVGAFAVFTRTGGIAANLAACGAAYAFVKNSSANLRETDDTWNYTYGGFAGGAILGLRLRTIPAILGYGAVAAIASSAFNFTGGDFVGQKQDPSIDEIDRKEALRKNRRRPIEETINNIGEGRGITAPGYAERRAQRLKERYGIDVSLSS